MADVTTLRSGRWGFSRPVQNAQGWWSTFAALQRLAPTVEHYWPPRVAGVPALDAVLVRLVGTVTSPSDGNTILFPRDITATDVTLSDLTGGQRNALQNTLTDWLDGYSYTDPVDGPRVIAPFSDRQSTYTVQTTLRAIALDVLRHFGHTASRLRPIVDETHNTEFVDDFATDPFAARWTQELGSAAHDAGNSEVDISFTGATNLFRYQANGPGSIEHEAQVTGIAGDDRIVGAAVRMASDGTDDAYFVDFDDTSGGELTFVRVNAGSAQILTTSTFGAFTVGDWYTIRLAAAGTAGNNVVLSAWLLDSNTSKPSFGGSGNWQGVDGSPDATYTDTDVNRLDDAVHAHCGIGGRSASNEDYDTRLSFWKERAISDRGGAPAAGYLLIKN